MFDTFMHIFGIDCIGTLYLAVSVDICVCILTLFLCALVDMGVVLSYCTFLGVDWLLYERATSMFGNGPRGA